MNLRVSSLCIATLGVLLLIGVAAHAVVPETHEGVVVKAGEGKLTMSDNDGKNERTFLVAADARINLDGKEARLEELHKGCRVKATVEVRGDNKAATRVEGRREK